ncbi:MAG: hypothetical protein ACRDTE_24850 [Pseudonocardiaceae bacterium]
MSDPTLSTFLPILIIVLVMIVWWRATVIIVGAFLIAVLVMGVNEVVDRIDQPAQGTVIAPPVGGDLLVPGPSSAPLAEPGSGAG